MTDDLIEQDKLQIPNGYEALNWVRGFGRQIGPLFEKIDGNRYTRGFRVSDYHVNGFGNCHGGMLMAFADVAFGHVVGFQGGKNWVTVRLLTDFVSGASQGDWVEGTGEIQSVADDIYTVKGRIWTGDKTILIGTGIFKALGERK